jgi:hypothetical protein
VHVQFCIFFFFFEIEEEEGEEECTFIRDVWMEKSSDKKPVLCVSVTTADGQRKSVFFSQIAHNDVLLLNFFHWVFHNQCGLRARSVPQEIFVGCRSDNVITTKLATPLPVRFVKSVRPGDCMVRACEQARIFLGLSTLREPMCGNLKTDISKTMESFQLVIHTQLELLQHIQQQQKIGGGKENTHRQITSENATYARSRCLLVLRVLYVP